MLERVVKRDRAVTLAGLLVLSALSWAYLLLEPMRAHGMGLKEGAAPSMEPAKPMESAAPMAPTEAMERRRFPGEHEESEEDEDLPP